ncbi:lipase family protein [Phaeacidiphilus oryzae]|uniref:lipase family protein n=1 Tax=Phaeacidiphilus oryzae TaxID=348818 RepID=UPI00056C37C4|nr:lipase family protein [Phaeacidiphilus oryzae]
MRHPEHRPHRPHRPHRSRRSRRLLATGALVVAAAVGPLGSTAATAAPAASAAPGAPAATGQSTGAAGPQEVSRGVAIPPFYDPPAQLPSTDGALVRTEPLRLALSLPGLNGPLPGTATRLMYRSTDSGGRPVAVTGAYIQPSAAWHGTGPRPVVAVASGTMGQGDQCAPSLALQNPLTVTAGTLSVGYEDLGIYRLLARGIAVVATYYVGLGSTDRLHTYVNRVDEGHALLDAVRAARELPGTDLAPDSKVGLYGYSQGGGASAAAAELQPSYAPDVQLAGVYSGAPPADLAAVVKGIDGSALAGALGWSINGFAQSYPRLKAVVDRYVNAQGKAALADLSTMCVGDAILHYGFQRSTSWTKDGESLSRIIAEVPALQQVLDDQRIGDGEPASGVPVRIATGTRDDIVPHAQARQLAVEWCAKGADVDYVPVRLPNLGDKLLTNHLAPMIADQTAAISWMADRLNGEPAASNCAGLPSQP